MYKAAHALFAQELIEIEAAQLEQKLASVSTDELVVLFNEKTAAPGFLKTLGGIAKRNPGMIAGSAVGALGGAYQGAQDGGGVSGALGGALLGGAGGAAAGHAIGGVGKRLVQGQGLGAAMKGYGTQVGREAQVLKGRAMPGAKTPAAAPATPDLQVPAKAAPVSQAAGSMAPSGPPRSVPAAWRHSMHS